MVLCNISHMVIVTECNSMAMCHTSDILIVT